MRTALLVLAVATIAVSSPVGQAAMVNYGDSPNVPPGLLLLGVMESSATDAVPLYGPPDYYAGGVDFDPVGFAAVANGGTSDIIDGQLNFTVAGVVTGQQIVVIDSINLVESGDLTLLGAGTSATSVLAGATMHFVVTQVDGMDIAPVPLWSASASVAQNLAASPGALQPWNLGLFADIDALLVGRNIPFVGGATRIEVVIDNLLVAFSEPGSAAFLAKRDFSLGFGTGFTPVTPEPGTVTLVCVALAGLGAIRRRRA
jgi:hypothetical protein